MGLDLYAGPLARYHTGAWETVIQRMGRETGMEVRMIYAETPPRLPRLLAPILVRRWLYRLRRRFSLDGLKWAESQGGAYWSDKPDHDGLVALLLAAAYAEHPEFTPPENPPENCQTDPAYSASSKHYEQSLIVILECQMFLPSDESFVVVTEDAVGVKRFITSTANLQFALDSVNAAHWQAGDGEFEEWAKRGLFATSRVVFEDGEAVRKEALPPSATPPFVQNAQYGFALYWEALKFSRAHNVPIVTDE